ncbi:MAG: hypothetical protein IKO17_06435 [Prevotella sp.]|jgi:hypothetical protein|uniref:hypothetical protein n=1 Tax=Prevotella sp. E13-27 TaxID=2938122 RepID=UPI002009FDBD|nr:hypothetical protein [Prevotella sp. E13-27]MBQ7663315.1 hypothetical protein [Prevotella sp.]MBR4566568.1 hypothetical protein [Prevotella sp.]MCK8620782.1 hypothetical protein [Prevotella sp. E13-27]
MKKIFTYMMLLVTVVVMSSCESEDHYISERLTNRDWQGHLGTYYNDRWGLTGDDYWTVMRFVSRDDYATSGRGYEVDFKRGSWNNDYAYSTFRWFVEGGEITIIYDDDQWTPVYISDYHLSGMHFYGYIDDGTTREIRFDFADQYFDNWNYYENAGAWRTRSANAPSSIVSGVFANK